MSADERQIFIDLAMALADDARRTPYPDVGGSRGESCRVSDFTPIEPQRVRMTQESQWAGEGGRLVAIHRRLPIYRIQLERQPINCSTREYLFGPEQFEVVP